MEKVEFRNYGRYEFVTSTNSNFIVLKFNNLKGSLNEFSEFLKSDLENDYLQQSGVYFLMLSDGYYIGETGDLFGRMTDHIRNKEVNTITIATYKSEIDKLDKETIRDLESILIEYAEEYGLNIGDRLKNKKSENRKTFNILNSRENKILAEYIWNKIILLNLRDIFDELKASRLKTNITSFENNNLPKLVNESVVMKNIVSKKIDENHNIFKYIDKRLNPTMGYMKKRMQIFNKAKTKIALYKYLYEGTSNEKIDVQLVNPKGKGYITAVTLAYLRIQTNGTARGQLAGKLTSLDAKKIIGSYVEENY